MPLRILIKLLNKKHEYQTSYNFRNTELDLDLSKPKTEY